MCGFLALAPQASKTTWPQNNFGMLSSKVGLEIGLSGFQVRPVSGPEIVDLFLGGVSAALKRFKTHPKWRGASHPIILDGF